MNRSIWILIAALIWAMAASVLGRFLFWDTAISTTTSGIVVSVVLGIGLFILWMMINERVKGSSHKGGKTNVEKVG